jgi:hypothetical protein
MDKKLKKKSLCKWEKDEVKKNWGDLVELVQTSKFICGRCLRSSRLKGNLCKPVTLV